MTRSAVSYSKLLFRLVPMKQVILFLILLLTLSCQHQPSFKHTVPHVDISRYMGTWYVLAGRFTPFERDVHHSVESYNWNPLRELIEIDFTYYQGSFDGKRVSLPQFARIYNQETNAHWKVTPFGLFQFDFLVIALADDYSWTAIGVPSQEYLWIMARRTDLSKAELNQLIQAVEATGYRVDSLDYVPHP
jgi:apolipoprotein D and lipocalin family protein